MGKGKTRRYDVAYAIIIEHLSLNRKSHLPRSGGILPLGIFPAVSSERTIRPAAQ